MIEILRAKTRLTSANLAIPVEPVCSGQSNETLRFDRSLYPFSLAHVMGLTKVVHFVFHLTKAVNLRGNVNYM